MFHQSRTTRIRPHAGVTLIELLIVMTILLMVTAAAIPLMMPAIQNRRGREAARLVSSFISGARSRAIETGRPVGVMLERFNGNGFSMKLSYVEVPAPYGGDTLTSRMLFNSSGQVVGIGVVSNGTITSADAQWKNFLRYGDMVKLDYKGTTYFLVSSPPTFPDPKFGTAITDDPSTVPWQLLTSTGVTPNFPAGYSTNGVPYQILRQPQQPRSSSPALQLSDNTVVDLFNSGIGSGGQFAVTTTPGPPATATVGFDPVLVFAPGGALDYMTDNNGGWHRPTGALYLLIGRRDQMPDAAPQGRRPTPTSLPLFNLTDPDSIWITVGYQTGLVVSAENLPPEIFTDTNGNGAKDPSESFVDGNGNGVWDGPESFTDSNGDGIWESGEPILNDLNNNGVCDSNVSHARTFAQQAQSMGGR